MWTAPSHELRPEPYKGEESEPSISKQYKHRQHWLSISLCSWLCSYDGKQQWVPALMFLVMTDYNLEIVSLINKPWTEPQWML